MEISNLISFLAVSILLTLAPGPDIIYVITQSISSGKKAGIATAMGLCTGLIVYTFATAFGISEIIQQSVVSFRILKYAGAAYLFYLAWQAFREKPQLLSGTPAPRKKLASLYKQGIYMNLLNPKVALFFLAFLPQFVNSGSDNVQGQMLLLGILFIIQAILIFTAVSVFAGMFGSRLSKNPNFSRYINLGKGGILILIGLKLAVGN